jgi:hypothetical protein
VAKRNRNSVVKAGAPAASGNDDNPLDDALDKLRTTISSGDVFSAELETSALIALLYMTDGAARETGLLADVFVGFASKELHGPEEARRARSSWRRPVASSRKSGMTTRSRPGRRPSG